MATELRIGIDTATIKSEGYSVRVAMEEGKAMFACHDILHVCGYKYTAEKSKKMAEDRRFPGVVKLLDFPILGNRGIRKIKMYFCDYTAAKEMIHRSNAGCDTIRWLEDHVLAYKRLPEALRPDTPEPKVEEESKTIDLEVLNRSLDRILVELVEIKKRMVLSTR